MRNLALVLASRLVDVLNDTLEQKRQEIKDYSKDLWTDALASPLPTPRACIILSLLTFLSCSALYL